MNTKTFVIVCACLAGIAAVCFLAGFFPASADSVTVDNYNHTSVIHWKSSQFKQGLEKVNEYADNGYFVSATSNNHTDIYVYMDKYQ